MAQHIRIPEAKIVTKNGECSITVAVEPIVIEINLNVNHEGMVSMASAPSTSISPPKEPEPTGWVVPEFNLNKKFKFGKNTN